MRPAGKDTLNARIPREVAALIGALRFQGAETHRLRELHDSEWKSLLEFSDSANLTLSLARLPHAGAPEWVERRLDQNLCETAMRFERVREVYREADATLRAAGIPYLVMKGFTQAPEYVSHPRLRTQSDLDFYCPPQHIPAAQDQLRRLGYRPVKEMEYYRFADHAPTLARPSNWVWKGNVFDPDKPLTIELHFCLWNETVTKISVPEVHSFWGRRVTRSIDGMRFPALHRVDHLGYFALHILREVLVGGWIAHHLYELGAFLDRHADDESFWAQWENDHSPYLRRLQAVVFSLARRWFACDVHGRPGEQIESLPQPWQAWLSQFGASPMEAMFRRNKDGRLLQFLLADDWPAKQLALRRAVIPSRIARPGETAARQSSPYAVRSTAGNKHLDYAWYLCRRSAIYLKGTAAFFAHALKLWLAVWVMLPKRQPPELHVRNSEKAIADEPS